MRDAIPVLDIDLVLSLDPMSIGTYSPSLATAEARLFYAALEDAAHNFLKPRNRHRNNKIIAEEQAWFSVNDHEYIFSFVNVCQVLHIDPSYFRRGLFARREALDAGEVNPIEMRRRNDHMSYRSRCVA